MSGPDDHPRRIAARFDRLAPTYDQEALRFFPFCADRLIALLAPAAGGKVLDVAAGTGAVTLGAAQAVGPAGRVVAVDLSEGMLGRLEAKLRHFGLGHVDIHVMNAGALDFRSNYFHHTVCGFGLDFMPDMAGALAEWVRVTRPGGYVLYSCHGPNAFRPMMDLLLAQLDRHGIAPATEGRMAASEQLQNVETSRALLTAAGLAEVEVRTVRVGYHLRPQAWWSVVEHSSVGELIERLGAEEVARLREVHIAEITRLADSDGVWLDVETHFAGGRRP